MYLSCSTTLTIHSSRCNLIEIDNSSEIRITHLHLSKPDTNSASTLSKNFFISAGDYSAEAQDENTHKKTGEKDFTNLQYTHSVEPVLVTSCPSGQNTKG